MAYLDHNHTHKRLAGVTGVALVHIVLALGLTAGLAINYVKDETPPIVIATFKPVPQPTPTETPEPADDPVVDTRPTAPVPPISFPQPSPSPLPTTPADPPTGTPRTAGDAPVGQPLPPQPTPAPVFTPRPPVPANGPRGWVTNDDYPRIAEVRGYEGTVGYLVEVDTRGRVTGCTVTSSSGYEVLDDTACRRIERRARFNPATDRNGTEVASTYRGSVSWQIPD